MKKVIFWKHLGLGSRQSLSPSSAAFYSANLGGDINFEAQLFLSVQWDNCRYLSYRTGFFDTKAGLKHEKDS